MGYWVVAFFVIFIVFEESIYYWWNRYLYGYGKKQFAKKKWLVKASRVFHNWKHRKQTDISS